MLPAYYSNIQRKKIADHTDFRLIGIRQDALYRIAKTQPANHDQCTQQIQNLTDKLNDLKQQLSDAISNREDIKTSFNGYPPLIVPNIIDSDDQFSNQKQLAFINNNLYYDKLRQYDNMKHAMTRDVVADRAHIQPDSKDQQILTLRQQLWSQQNKLMNCYQFSKKIDMQIQTEEDNEFMKSRILAECSLINSKILQENIELNTSYAAEKQANDKLTRILQQKESRIIKLSHQLQNQEDCYQILSENQELMIQIARHCGQEKVELIQHYAYLTVLYEELKEQERNRLYSQQKVVRGSVSERQSIEQPIPQRITERTSIIQQLNQQNTHFNSLEIPGVQPIFSNQPILINQILNHYQKVDRQQLVTTQNIAIIQDQQNRQQRNIASPSATSQNLPAQAIELQTRTTVIQQYPAIPSQQVNPQPGCDPYYLLPG